MFEQLFDEIKLLTYFFVVLRIGGIMFTVPIFSSGSIKPHIRMALAIVTAIIIYPFVEPVPFNADIPPLLFILNIAKELVIGMAIGTLTATLFSGVLLGGYLLDFQMGFSMVNVMDPDTGSQYSYMAQVINVMLMLIFIAIGGPGLIMQSIDYSYTLIPLGNFEFSPNAFLYAVNLFTKVFIIAVTLLAPALITLMAANAVMGVLGKLIPQINLMVVGFPIKISIGIIIFIFSAHLFYIAFEKVASGYFRYIKEFIKLVTF